MSAPTKAEQLEEYAGTIGMSGQELMEFCLDQIVAQGGKEATEDEEEIWKYLRATLWNPEWIVENLFRAQAWELKGTVGFFADCLTEAAERAMEFDT